MIGDDGEQLGIMSAEAALKIAEEKELDLVKISPMAKPPVCKLMDYGKFRFEQAKREKEAKKNQRVMEIKEIRMSPGIGENDLNTKLKSALKFLADGDRVKVSIRFRGREMAHTNIGAGRIVYQELTRITKSIQDGDFFQNEAFLSAIENVKKNHSALHLMRLLSDGGVVCNQGYGGTVVSDALDCA